jgi:pimeloyl-ACP methyl ester carboxylesterase
VRETHHEVVASDGWRLGLTELHFDDPVKPSDEAFVFVHGLAQNRTAFSEGDLPKALLARGARVFCAELRGHGKSRGEGRSNGWGLAEHLRRDLPALIARACELSGADGVHLLGHSMGGILGYAYLAEPDRVRSLVTFGAPLVLGAGRPILKSAATILAPFLEAVAPSTIPIDLLLRASTLFAIMPVSNGIVGALSDVVRLGNPAAASPERLRYVLERADPTAKRVFLELIEIARTGRAVIDGVDLVDAVTRSPLPVMAVIGGRDIFASSACVEPLRAGPGKRRIIELPEAAHVDLTIGHHCTDLADTIWTFALHP